jgi:hypothetical protein
MGRIHFATQVCARRSARPWWPAAGLTGEWLAGPSRWVGWVLAQ